MTLFLKSSIVPSVHFAPIPLQNTKELSKMKFIMSSPYGQACMVAASVFVAFIAFLFILHLFHRRYRRRIRRRRYEVIDRHHSLYPLALTQCPNCSKPIYFWQEMGSKKTITRRGQKIRHGMRSCHKVCPKIHVPESDTGEHTAVYSPQQTPVARLT